MWAEPGDHVDIDEPIAQVETDKVLYKFWALHCPHHRKFRDQN